MADPAEVKYFFPALTGGTTTVTTVTPSSLTLDPKGNNIQQTGTVDLTVGRGRISIRFTAQDSNGNDCAVVGIVIDPESGGDPYGRTAFPLAAVGPNGLTLADHNPSAGTYDFMLLVQDAQNQLGLIDPKITNQG